MTDLSALPVEPWCLGSLVVLAGLASTFLALAWANVRRTRRELARFWGPWARASQARLRQDLTPATWQALVEPHRQAIREQILRHGAAAQARVERELDAAFFLAAVKGSIADLPAIGQPGWRTEFQSTTGRRLDGWIDEEGLDQRVQEVMERAVVALEQRWWGPRQGLPPALASQDPARLRALVDLPPVLDRHLLPSSFLGPMFLASTVREAWAMTGDLGTMDLVWRTLGKDSVQELILSLAQELVLEVLGEEVIAEVAQALIGFLSGVLAIAALYRSASLAWRFKRMFIDQEPVIQLRRRVNDRLRDRFEELAELRSRQACVALAHHRDRCLAECRELEALCDRWAPGSTGG